MNGEDFFNAINMIDDDLIEEAAVIKKRKKSRKMLFAALAACLAVFVYVSIVVIGSLGGDMSINDVPENENQYVTENVVGNTSGGTGNMTPESANPEYSTEIYIPETADPEVQATAPGENTGSTSPSESVTGVDTSLPPEAAETTTGKSQEYNGNATQQGVVFKARITEISGDSVMVEPLQAPESSSSDKIVFSKAGLEELDVKKGDVVLIVYDGLIMETYPAQINASSWSLAE